MDMGALDWVRLRVLLLVERVHGWVSLWVETGGVYDQTAEILLGASLVWLLGAMLSWTMVRMQKPLIGGVAAGGLLAYCLFIVGQGVGLLVAFVVVLLGAQAYAAYRTSQQRWDANGVDWPFPDSLLPEWMSSAWVIALLIGLLAWGAAWVATPEGWQKMGDWLRPAAQETATRSVDQNGSPTLAPPETVVYSAEAVSATMPDLEQIGGPPDRSVRTVFWVAVSDPPPAPIAAGQVTQRSYYWRSGVFDLYTGSGWRSILPQGELPSIVASGQDPPLGRSLLEQQFDLVVPVQGVLPAMNLPVIAGEGTRRVRAGDEDTALLMGTGRSYRVVSWVNNVTVAQLRSAGTEYPAEIVAAYLQLPQSLPQRVRLLAEQLTEGAETPYDRAKRIEMYVRTYPYSLDVAPPPQGRDVVDYFLFDAQTGFCSYYASAMVVMLRVVGVPARVATGFAGGEYDAGRGAYRVPASAAHAWVEVYFPGYGWVEFEPTAVYASIERRGDAPIADRKENSARGSWNGRLWLGIALGSLLVLMGVLLWLGQGRKRSRLPAVSLYGQLRRDLALAGFVGEAAQTPREFLLASRAQLAEQPKVLCVLEQATDLLERTLFSQDLPRTAQIRVVRKMYLRSVMPLLALWLKHWIRERKHSV
jgi:transglutaminase-like putative cysteine protease